LITKGLQVEFRIICRTLLQ